MICAQVFLLTDSLDYCGGLSLVEDLIYRELLLDLHKRSRWNHHSSNDLVLL